MNAFLWAAAAMLVASLPCAVVLRRGRIMEAVVAYQAIATVVVMVLALMAQGLDRSGEFELPVLVAVLTLGGGLVFVRLLERWL